MLHHLSWRCYVRKIAVDNEFIEIYDCIANGASRNPENVYD
uniref:Uncharacterized protein n=1 Tax=Chlorobium phaeobacteroides (strain BS1) TaxID=331678 RepID=B3EKK4_CHLPB